MDHLTERYLLSPSNQDDYGEGFYDPELTDTAHEHALATELQVLAGILRRLLMTGALERVEESDGFVTRYALNLNVIWLQLSSGEHAALTRLLP